MERIKFEKIEKELPFFYRYSAKRLCSTRPSEEQKEWADRVCKWLFYDGSMPEEAKQFINFMRVVHNE